MNPSKVIVVGAGPAGLMAAGRAAQAGVCVVIMEKMHRPGLKLSITGKGRCNLTNIAPLDEFLGHFGSKGVFLRQAFGRFFCDDLIDLLEKLGLETVVERGGRVFPRSQDANGIVRSLVQGIRDDGVQIRTGTTVQALVFDGNRVVGVQWKRTTQKGTYREKSPVETETADAVIVATGGLSYPATGSTGDGYTLARSAGHTLVDTRPALVPLVTAGSAARRLQGLSLKNVSLAVLVDGKREAEGFGEMLFTHFGLSGPIVLSASQTAVNALQAKKSVEIAIDLKPALDEDKLDTRLLRDIQEHGKTQAKNLLKLLLPQKLIPIALESSGIHAEKPAHQISAEDRRRLRLWLKDFRFRLVGHRPISEAIVTAGGVTLEEIDPRTMASRLAEGLYFCGELLDVNADTGGYNLQAAFSTGWLAGDSAAKKLLSARQNPSRSAAAPNQVSVENGDDF